MANTQELGTRIHLLESRAAVADLVHRYALNIRTRQPEACAALFTGDGTFEIRDTDPAGNADFVTRATCVGREAVMAYVAGSTRSDFHVFPMIRNVLVEVDVTTTPPTASATSLMSSRTWPAGAEVFGEYHDSFREDDGVWRFTGRIFTIYRRPA